MKMSYALYKVVLGDAENGLETDNLSSTIVRAKTALEAAKKVKCQRYEYVAEVLLIAIED